MKFKFRLDRLLQLREREERNRAQELGRAVQAEAERRAALEEASRRLEAASEEISRPAGRITPVGTLRNLALTIEAATRAVEAAQASHHVAVNGRDAEQEKFVAARQERRAVERLKEIRAAAWQQESGRREQGDTDEIAGRRHRQREET